MTEKAKPAYDNKKYDRTFFYAYMIWVGAGVIDYLDGAVIFALYFVRDMILPLAPLAKDILRYGLFPLSAIAAIIYDCVAILTAILDRTPEGKFKKENWIRVAVNTLTAVLAVGAVIVGLTLGAAGSIYTLAMYGVNLSVSSLYQFISMTYHLVQASRKKDEMNKHKNIPPVPFSKKIENAMGRLAKWLNGVGNNYTDSFDTLRDHIYFSLTGEVLVQDDDTPEDIHFKKLTEEHLSRRNKALSHFVVGITSILVAAAGFAVGTLGLPYAFILGVTASLVGAAFFGYAFVRDARNQRAADKKAAEKAKNAVVAEGTEQTLNTSTKTMMQEMGQSSPQIDSAGNETDKIFKPSDSLLFHPGEAPRTAHHHHIHHHGPMATSQSALPRAASPSSLRQ